MGRLNGGLGIALGGLGGYRWRMSWRVGLLLGAGALTAGCIEFGANTVKHEPQVVRHGTPMVVPARHVTTDEEVASGEDAEITDPGFDDPSRSYAPGRPLRGQAMYAHIDACTAWAEECNRIRREARLVQEAALAVANKPIRDRQAWVRAHCDADGIQRLVGQLQQVANNGATYDEYVVVDRPDGWARFVYLCPRGTDKLTQRTAFMMAAKMADPRVIEESVDVPAAEPPELPQPPDGGCKRDDIRQQKPKPGRPPR